MARNFRIVTIKLLVVKVFCQLVNLCVFAEQGFTEFSTPSM